jgi:mannose/fructose/N-acetylgalactosamine-specific phosphotransferase system component IID
VQPGFKILFQCFLRTYLVEANFNTRGMQNVGFSFAIDPGLVALHSNPKRLRRARRRYLQHYNTHPFWTPLLVGFFLYLERKITRGLLSEKSVGSIRETTVYTLSAIGDSFFGGALMVFWALTTVLFWLLFGSMALVLAWMGGWFITLQLFKFYTLYKGLKDGLLFLQRLRQWDLINTGQTVKIINAFLIVGLWLQIFPIPDAAYWLPMALAMCSLAWLSSKLYWTREVLFAAFILASVLYVRLS